MQTFANVFQGIVNVASRISHEDVEDFASACIVVFLYTGAVKMFVNLLRKVYMTEKYTRDLCHADRRDNRYCQQ